MQTWNNAILAKGASNFLKWRTTPFFKEKDNNEIAKIHWQTLNVFFSRTTGPISTNLGTRHPCVKGAQVLQIRTIQFSKRRWWVIFLFLINFICYIHKFFLIWNDFSVERCGPWASCSNLLPLIATTVHISFVTVHEHVYILHKIAISYISRVVVWSWCPHINFCQCLNFYKNLVKWRKHHINSPVIKIP